MTTKVAPGIAKEAGLGKVSNADVQAAVAARARLAEAGVEVDADGRVAFQPSSAELVCRKPVESRLAGVGQLPHDWPCC